MATGQTPSQRVQPKGQEISLGSTKDAPPSRMIGPGLAERDRTLKHLPACYLENRARVLCDGQKELSRVEWELWWSGYIAAIKTMTKASWRGKGLFGLHIPGHDGPLKNAKAGTWGQELKQRPWSNTAY